MVSADSVEGRIAAKLKRHAEARRTGRNSPRLTEAEANYLTEALKDVGANFSEGDLRYVCPRCDGTLEASVNASGCGVSCRSCDLLMTVRGI